MKFYSCIYQLENDFPVKNIIQNRHVKHRLPYQYLATALTFSLKQKQQCHKYSLKKGKFIPRQYALGQTCQLSRVTHESHGFLHFLQSHGRGNSCSRVYSCPTVLFSHRLLPIIIAGNTFWQHKFSVNETEACFLATGKFRGATEAT